MKNKKVNKLLLFLCLFMCEWKMVGRDASYDILRPHEQPLCRKDKKDFTTVLSDF